MRRRFSCLRPLALFPLLVLGAGWPALAADGGAHDGGALDGGVLDGGTLGGGAPDAGSGDAGLLDGGGADAGVGDAGAADAGAADAGFADAGVDPGLGEGQLCDPFDDQCARDLLCVPYPFAPDLGTCARECGVYDDAGVLVGEDAGPCVAPRTCQSVVDNRTFEDVGAVCLSPQPTRDAVCLAPGDDGACSGGMSCLVAALPDPDLGIDAAELRCKLGCDKEAPEGEAGCPSGELCFSSRIVQDFELDGAGNPKSCSLSACEAAGPSCQCSLAAGFECARLEGGPAGDFGTCVLLPGQCGTPSRSTVAADLEEGFLPLEVICNDVTQHRFCDQRGYPEIDGVGTNLCLLQGQLGDGYTGLCFAFCSAPDADLNGDGSLGVDEQGFELGCREGERCYTDVARALYLANGPTDPSGPYGLRECDPVACPPGQPCPSTCGPGDTECVTIDDVGGPVSVCLAFFGSCEPERPGDDAGPSGGDDAGLPVEDAGSGPDAGLEPGPDAGEVPAGDGGGLGGDDRGVTRRGCGCSASGPGSPLEGGLLGVALVALTAALSRRRRAS